jgi:hypothetical protein
MTVFLILGHRDPAHVNMLVEALSPSKIILHVDRKSELRKHGALLHAHENLMVLDSKYSINVKWAGFSQIRAMWLLMEEALKYLAPKEKIIFLSGGDFPLKSVTKIESYIDNFENLEFMRYFFLDGRIKDRNRWETFNRWDWRIFKDRTSKMYRVNSLLIRCCGVLETAIRGRKTSPDWPLASSSQWFAISRECIEELKKLRDRAYDAFFETSFAPDELYFATLFSRSSFSKKNIDGGEFIPNSNNSRIWQASNLTFVDESFNRFLDIEDLQHLSDSSFLFARKFDSKQGKHIVETIISELW